MLSIPKNNALQIMLLVSFNFALISAKRGGGGGGGRTYRGGAGGGGSGSRFAKSPGAIAGTVLACVAFVLVTIFVLVRRRRKQLAMEQEERLGGAEVPDLEDQIPYAQRVAMEGGSINRLGVVERKNERKEVENEKKGGIFGWRLF